MLELGTIIYLKEGNKKIMIIGRGQTIEKDGEEAFFDYAGCLYPEGINPKESLFFNEENIDRVIALGYSDEEELRYKELVSEWKKTNSFTQYRIQ
ncbi:DUF4176 domain-containing protein [Listeria kieliensis]|uniref:DUF4176 domain-containing protein n=1 Tax=Listeria kieliensis TaxID=1621700 RepID=A0A3D8TSU8_9LIST|nr:DUF4176 domain-containing protein [Listeria kieliensis]RDX02068.1 hypothetical protein UR08_00560 [Listeria kieliensis]